MKLRKHINSRLVIIKRNKGSSIRKCLIKKRINLVRQEYNKILIKVKMKNKSRKRLVNYIPLYYIRISSRINSIGGKRRKIGE